MSDLYTHDLNTFLNLENGLVLHVTNFCLGDKLDHYKCPELVQPRKRVTIFKQCLHSEFMVFFLAWVKLGGADIVQCQEKHIYVSQSGLLVNLSNSIPQKKKKSDMQYI